MILDNASSKESCRGVFSSKNTITSVNKNKPFILDYYSGIVLWRDIFIGFLEKHER